MFRRYLGGAGVLASLILASICLALSTPALAAPSAPSFRYEQPGATRVTNNPRPPFLVYGDVGSTIDLYMNGVLRGSALMVEGPGVVLTASAPLPDGSYETYLIARDGSGASPRSPSLTVIVDTVPPPVPTIIRPASGDILTSPLLRTEGLYTRSSSLRQSLNGIYIQDLSSNVAGGSSALARWDTSYQKPLTPGNYVLEVQEVDDAGNRSAPARTTFQVAEFGPPPMPTIGSRLDANIMALELFGGAQELSTVYISVDGAALTPIKLSGSRTRWDVASSPSIPLSEGPHAIEVYAENSAGRSPVNRVTLNVDRTRPAPPVLMTPAAGSVFTNRQQVFSGTAEPNSDVIISITGCTPNIAYFGRAGTDGRWSVVVGPTNVNPPETQFCITSRDAARNVSAPAAGGATYRSNPTSNAPPVAAAVAAQVIAGQGETGIPLRATGVFTGYALGAAPANGTVQIRGGFAYYTPAAGFLGADSFTYTATGPGGTSSPATVSVTVDNPPAPTAAPVSATVPFGSSGMAILLAPSGIFTAVQVSTPPAHGAVSIQGETATYTPAAGYSGPDAFQYVSVGPGGTSVPAIVSITVSAAAAPGLVEPGYIETEAPAAGQPTRIELDLTRLSSAGATGFRTATAPLFGSVEFVNAGGAPTQFRLRYTAPPGAMGRETFQVVAVGPGGESAPVTISINVFGRAPDLSGRSTADRPLAFRPLDDLRGGPFVGLEIVRGPATGRAILEGDTIVYIPSGPFTTVEIAYAVLLPFGQSGEGVIRINGDPPPSAQDLRIGTLAGRPVTVRITDGAQGGPFTAAQVVSVSPDAGTARIVAAGDAAGRTYDLTFTPESDFTGEATVAFTLSNAVGSTPGRLVVSVEGRPDPSLDPDVRGIAAAQVISAQRFSQAQISNVQRRLERLRFGDNGPASDLTLNLTPSAADPRAFLPGFSGADASARESGSPEEAAFLASRWPEAVDDSAAARLAPEPTLDAGSEAASTIGIWVGGSVDWARDEQPGQRDRRVTTSGLTVGLDARLTPEAIAGFAIGYGSDRTRIGDAGSLTEGDGLIGALYASVRPAGALFIDGAVGVGSVRMESQRWAPGLAGDPDAFVRGSRSGDVLFASASIGQTGQSASMKWSYYGRFDAGRIHLDPFLETGSAFSALAWEGLEQKSLAAALGVTTSWDWDLRERGRLAPSLRLEWGRQFEDLGTQTVRYGDWIGGPGYSIQLDRWSRDTLRIGLGVEWNMEPWSIGAGYRGEYGEFGTSNGGEVGLRWNW